MEVLTWKNVRIDILHSIFIHKKSEGYTGIDNLSGMQHFNLRTIFMTEIKP